MISCLGVQRVHVQSTEYTYSQISNMLGRDAAIWAASYSLGFSQYCLIAHKSTNSTKPDLYLGLALKLDVHSPEWHSISSMYRQYIHVSSMHHQLTMPKAQRRLDW